MSINIGPPAVEELRPRITVIGVGGAGGNAIANMISAGIEGVDFVVANTDAQALNNAIAEHRIQLGTDITQGLGAGARPEVGRAAAEESLDLIDRALEGVQQTTGQQQAPMAGDGSVEETCTANNYSLEACNALQSLDETWAPIFQQANVPFQQPTLVFYQGGTDSGCGAASSAMGPFYCPADQGIYIDTDFYRTMDRELGAGGQFARDGLIELLGDTEKAQGVKIFIGSENKLFSLSGSSVILSPYKDANQKVVGVLGVIGPTRLNYARVVPVVDYTANVISAIMSAAVMPSLSRGRPQTR